MNGRVLRAFVAAASLALLVAPAALALHAEAQPALEEGEDALLEVKAEERTSIPQQCAMLETVHGPAMVHGWLMTTAAVAPNRTMTQVCTEALECKLLLQPLMTADNQFRRACPKDCSGQGVCNNGVCACSAGYSGDDCSVERCPGNCRGNGECRLGKCFCAPGFTGDSCEKQVDCYRAPDGKVCGGHGMCQYGKCFCDPGFTNENCTQVTRCPKDCSNVGFCLHGQCFCPPGLGGPDCSVKLSAGKCPNFCSGHGECHHGQCHCDAGHYGRDCSQVRECPIGDNGLQCSGHGSCHNGRCQCDEGHTGFHCALQTTCAGNGTCSGRGVCWLGTCYCHPGYRGAACEKDQPCLNGCSGKGVCCGGRCKCLPGYFGRDCSTGTGPKIVLDGQVQSASCPSNVSGEVVQFDQATIKALQQTGKPCPNACSGLGVCLNGTCACLPGVDGVDCGSIMERIPCPNKCNYRGVCVFGKCHCMPPYTGVDCVNTGDAKLAPLKLNECPNQCNGRGACRKHNNGAASCACDPGYAGAACEIEVPCKHNCHGRGICDRGKCFCFPGFAGTFCHQAAKCPGGCSNHGQCFYGKCFCDPFYFGEDCSKTPTCPSGCSLNRGTCRGNDVCVCEPGYTGVACTEKLQCPNDCSGVSRGRCVATESGVKCVCNKEWSGDDCSKSADKCPNDCSGYGVCLLGKCQCANGRAGADCSIRVDNGNLATLGAQQLPQALTPAQGAPRFAETRAEAAAKTVTSALSRAGAATELSCPNGCSNHGVCANGQCFCNPGRTGDDCAQVVTCPNDCSGHGLCKYGQCWCGPNHVGDDCSVYTTAARQFPAAMIAAIIAVAAFFVGIIVGRKTLARTGLKFAQGIGAQAPTQEAGQLRDPIS